MSTRTHLNAYLAWIDMETTGLHMDDHIVEIAVILTDTRLNELGKYSTLVRPRPSTFARLMTAAPAVYEMHQSSGLTAELSDADEATLPTLDEVDAEVRALIEEHVPSGATVHIAGGGVAQFDQPRVREFMPLTAERLHYRPIDVSIIVSGYQMATGDTQTLTKSGAKAHRALADIEEDLSLARLVWSTLKVADALEQVSHSPMERVMRAASLATSLERDDLRDVQRLLDEQSPQDVVAGLSTVTSYLARELAKSRGVTIGAVWDEVRMIAARSGD